ncbi:PIN domain-containing protein, partial [Mycobacterium tuberculosis]
AHARTLHHRHPGLGARDLLHLACCQRRGVTRIKTFDHTLASAFRS